MICNLQQGLPSHGFPCPFQIVAIDYFSPTDLFSINNPTLILFQLFKAQRHDAAAYGNVIPIATLWCHRCSLAPPPEDWFSGLIESNTTLREGRGNPIRVSKICNPRRGLPSRGCSKSWTWGWDSRVPPSMWCLIIFLILVQKCAKYV